MRILRVGLLAAVAVTAWTPPAAAGPSTPVSPPDLVVRVDPRVELLSILFHLAGRNEYDMTVVAAWEDAAAAHFRCQADHPALVMTRRLAGPYDVGFFTPMNLAVHLTEPPELEVRSPLAESGSIHRTWTTFPDTTSHYLDLVRRFAEESDFGGFLADNAALVDSTEARLRRLVSETVDTEWFDGFWGTAPAADFVLVPGLTNGRASYGVEYRDPEVHELYAITGVSETDASGLPVFGEAYTATVVHELNHPYANPLVESELEALEPPAEALYASHAEAMRRQAIGSGETLLHESLVRAAVARYRADTEGRAGLEAEVREQVELGFTWMPGLVALLGDYESARDTYPDLAAFMPRIVDYFRQAAAG